MDRPPLIPPDVVRDPFTEVRVVKETGSTNADLLAAATDTRTGTVLVAESQLAGRGRLGRGWVAPPRAGLTFSMLFRPAVPPADWGWLPLLTGLGLRDALRDTSGVEVALKWPNDVLAGAGRRKAAGVLAQAAGDAIVVGIGLNVTTTEDELGLPTATSLAIEGGACLDRGVLLVAVLDGIAARYRQWGEGDPGLAAEYRAACATIGQQVRVTGVAAPAVVGVAATVDDEGRLVVSAAGGERFAVAAGDVEHVRPVTG